MLRTFLVGLLLTASAFAQTIRPTVGELKSHIAQPGEDLFSIASKYRVAVDHLAMANGFPITTISVADGARLIIPTMRVLPANPPANGLVINLAERGVFLFKGGRFHGFYPISIGDEVVEKGRFQTPSGQYSIIEKQKNPTWYPPGWAKDRRPVGPGPQNPLGDRWIGLSLTRTGIHGTNDPYNIGNSVTHGCMRTYPELVRELYDLVSVGMPARIEYEPAKLGRDPQGRLVVVTFPDVYKRRDPLKLAANYLRAAKVQPARKNWESVLGLNLGFPVEVSNPKTVYDEVAARLGW